MKTTEQPSIEPPVLSIWFGNFFEPFYSDYEATRKGIADIAKLGFNSINLDSKPWEDFFDRYAGGEAQASMVEHVEGRLKLYGDGMRKSADGRVIMQTMFDPIPKPSLKLSSPSKIPHRKKEKQHD